MWSGHDLSRLAIVVRVDESQLQKRDSSLPGKPSVPGGRPVAEADIRASDADRDQVADILREALAEGRLTTDEHADRIETLYSAKTMGELEPLTRDLPVPGGQAAPRPAASHAGQMPHIPPRSESPTMIAVFGGASRRGRWRVGSEIKAFALFGGIEIDLTEAVFESPYVTINITAVFGGVDVKVPENVTVRGDGGVGIFGGFDVKGYEAEESGAPVVQVRGLALFGGAEVKRKKGKRLKQWARKHLDEFGQGHGHGHGLPRAARGDRDRRGQLDG